MGMATFMALFLAAASPEETICVGANTQFDMDQCVGAGLQRADRVLNRTYAEVMAKLRDDKKGQMQLRTAQRAWIAFRDSECSFQTNRSEGGTIHSMVFAMCATALTSQRTAELKSYLNCDEGDFQCPVPSPE